MWSPGRRADTQVRPYMEWYNGIKSKTGTSQSSSKFNHRTFGATCSMKRRIDARVWLSVKPPSAKFPATSVK